MSYSSFLLSFSQLPVVVSSPSWMGPSPVQAGPKSIRPTRTASGSWWRPRSTASRCSSTSSRRRGTMWALGFCLSVGWVCLVHFSSIGVNHHRALGTDFSKLPSCFLTCSLLIAYGSFAQCSSHDECTYDLLVKMKGRFLALCMFITNTQVVYNRAILLKRVQPVFLYFIIWNFANFNRSRLYCFSITATSLH